MAERDERQEGIKGAVEDMKGRVKETAGTFLGRDDMEREGSAQQEKGRAQQTAAEKEQEAKRAEEQASEAEDRKQR